MTENEISEKKKQVIGLYGEMRLSMQLHDLGWQVHRAYIDEGIDFVITKYYCPVCQKYSNQCIQTQIYKGKKYKCVTNLCASCKKTPLTIISRYLQVKTSEGITTKQPDVKKFSFHPKIRYDMGKEIFYIWIAVFEKPRERLCHFYIFNTSDVKLFDDINLPTYKITDNQKTELSIREDGCVVKKAKKHNYSCFNELFYNNWDSLELEIQD